ncbi:hypothetical protein C8T65DRAFT_745221 [Cerioporus squamosus]|nr:hypothetical protein C8T65DRAFT_745221 [Cerioporus squamosus]
MTKHNNTNKRPDGGQSRTPSPPGRRPPIILVPTTPSTPGQVPVATEDEASPSPTPTIQGSPRSYAQVAALPAATTNVIVWPRNVATAQTGGHVTPINDAAGVPVTTEATRNAGDVGTTPDAPVLGPTTTQLEDVDDILELMPPQAFPWAAAEFPNANQLANVDYDGSPLPTSSPIEVPSTATATPSPADGMYATFMQSQPAPFDATGSLLANANDEYWGHFGTPLLPGSGLPSALQTPRPFSAHTNVDLSSSLAPRAPRQFPTNSHVDDVDQENIPPGTATTTPGAARAGKRRRGATPASGERAKKSARRKGKGRARLPSRSPRGRPGVEAENPWAATRFTISEEGQDYARMPPPPFNPFSFTTSIPGETSTAANSRQQSATPSLYGTFNVSGSYPTPHAMTDTPQQSRAGSTRSSTLQTPLTSRSPAASPQTTPLSFARRDPYAMEVDSSRGGGTSSKVPSTSLPGRSTAPDTTMDEGPSRFIDSDTSARQRLRDLLSDPRSMDDRPRASQSPTVEDVPEDGELDGTQRAPGSSYYDWDQYTGIEGSTRYEGFTLPPRDTQRERSHDEELLQARRQYRRGAGPGTFFGGMGSRFADEWDARTPRRMARDEEYARRLSPRQHHIPRGAPVNRLPRNVAPAAFHAPASTSAPSNRLHSLDVFDVGENDNLPKQEGDPEVHRHDAEAHFRGMSDEWVQEVWEDPANTSLTLNTYNPRFTRSYGTNRRTAADLRRRITQTTGESDFRIIAPDQAPNHRGRGPVEWAVTGLSREAVEMLLRRRVWSFRSISFFPRRRALEIPTMLLALEGFLEDNITNIEAAVRATFERLQVRQRVEQMIRVNPEFSNIPAHEAYRRVMATLRVTIYTLDNGTVVANVFMRSPTQNVHAWRQWVHELRGLTFGSYHTGIARARRISACAGCLGVDHPSHLCPFLRMPGWNGPDTAGGASYSADGRELHERRARTNPSDLNTQTQRASRNYPAYGPESSQASTSRGGITGRERCWDEPAREDSRDRNRDQRREGNGDRHRRGPSRRNPKDGTRPSKGGHDGSRKEGRR